MGRSSAPAREISFVSLVTYGPKVSDSALAMGGYSQRRRAKSLFLNGLLLGSMCTGIQVKLVNHCQAVRIKQ